MTDRSGSARRARGLRRLTAWLPERTVDTLRALAEDSGLSVPELLGALVEDEWERLRAIAPDVSPRSPQAG